MLEGPTNYYHPEAALKPTIKEFLALTDITQFNGAEDALIRIVKNSLCSHFFPMVNMAAKLLIEASNCPTEAKMFRHIFQRSFGYTDNKEPPTELVGFIALLELVICEQEETLERTNAIGDVRWWTQVSEWFQVKESQRVVKNARHGPSSFIKAVIVKEDGYKDATDHLSSSAPDGKVPYPLTKSRAIHRISRHIQEALVQSVLFLHAIRFKLENKMESKMESKIDILEQKFDALYQHLQDCKLAITENQRTFLEVNQVRFALEPVFANLKMKKEQQRETKEFATDNRNTLRMIWKPELKVGLSKTVDDIERRFLDTAAVRLSREFYLFVALLRYIARENLTLINRGEPRPHKGQDWWAAVATWFQEKIEMWGNDRDVGGWFNIVQRIISHERILHPEDPVARFSPAIVSSEDYGFSLAVPYGSNQDSTLKMPSPMYTSRARSVECRMVSTPATPIENEYSEDNFSRVGYLDYTLDDNYSSECSTLFHTPVQAVRDGLPVVRHPNFKIFILERLNKHRLIRQ
ncbi:hypothetical protein M422DRAFT_246174 [Sphaerobolus stellatus SS14]|nr:hypothetical protein M422DRAFT_246174 [Sphaerobolus stellatus SS14]